MIDEIKEVTDKAIADSYDHADATWREMALECVKQVCFTHEKFTMNDVRWLINNSPIKTHDRRAVGGVIKKAQKLGWVMPTGETIRSKVGHGVPLQIWRSKLYKQKTTLF